MHIRSSLLSVFPRASLILMLGALTGCTASGPPAQAQRANPNPPTPVAFHPGTPLMHPATWAQVKALDGTGTPADLLYANDSGNCYGGYAPGVWIAFPGGGYSSCDSTTVSSCATVTTCSPPSPPGCR